MRREKLLGQPLRLFAEEEKTAVGIIHVCVAVRGFGREQTHTAYVIFQKKIPEIFIYTHVDQMPVVKARALDRLVGDVKAKRLDEVQHAAGGGARAGDIAGI